MTAKIIELYPKTTPHKPVYELYWFLKSIPTCIASQDLSRIHRQMVSLANRGITASLYADGWPVGHVSQTPTGIFTVTTPKLRASNGTL